MNKIIYIFILLSIWQINIIFSYKIQYGSHLYSYFNKQLTQSQANDFCTTLFDFNTKNQGYLVKVDTKDELLFLQSIIPNSRTWISASRNHDKGYFFNNIENKHQYGVTISNNNNSIEITSLDQNSLNGFICEWGHAARSPIVLDISSNSLEIFKQPDLNYQYIFLQDLKSNEKFICKNLFLMENNQYRCSHSAPPGFYDIRAKVEKHLYQNPSTKQLMYYTPEDPDIDTIEYPYPSVLGGNITIIAGYIFDDYMYRPTFYLNSKPINGCIEMNIEEAICYVPPGTGFLDLQIKFLDLGTSTYKYYFNYRPPRVFNISSVKRNVGGNVTIEGVGFVNQTLNVYVGYYLDSVCSVLNVSFTKIICYLNGKENDDGEGLPVEVNINGIYNNWIYSPYFYYQDETNSSSSESIGSSDNPSSSESSESCPICLNGGSCNQILGVCTCSEEWTGSSCDIKVDNNSLPPPVVDSSGTTIIIGNGINYTISFTHLREKDTMNRVIRSQNLTSINWKYIKNNTVNQYQYSGSFVNDSVTIDLMLHYYPNQSFVEFAGENITMARNSMKYIIKINDWSFRNQLNSLEIIFSSVTNKSSNNGCVDQDTSVKETKGESLNWYEVDTGLSILSAKFAQHMYIDERIVKSNVRSLEKNDPLYTITSQNQKSNETNEFRYLVAITVPAFMDSCVIDPNFSSLIKSEKSKSNGCGPSSMDKWKIIVIAAVAGAGFIFIVVGVSLFTVNRLKQRKLRSDMQKRVSELHSL